MLKSTLDNYMKLRTSESELINQILSQKDEPANVKGIQAPKSRAQVRGRRASHLNAELAEKIRDCLSDSYATYTGLATALEPPSESQGQIQSFAKFTGEVAESFARDGTTQ